MKMGTLHMGSIIRRLSVVGKEGLFVAPRYGDV